MLFPDLQAAIISNAIFYSSQPSTPSDYSITVSRTTTTHVNYNAPKIVTPNSRPYEELLPHYRAHLVFGATDPATRKILISSVEVRSTMFPAFRACPEDALQKLFDFTAEMVSKRIEEMAKEAQGAPPGYSEAGGRWSSSYAEGGRVAEWTTRDG